METSARIYDGGLAPRAAPAVLDLEHLRRYTMGQVAFEREILSLFSETLSRTLSALDEAKSLSEWHMAAHTLKGSALGIGAQKLAGLARAAELVTLPAPAERGRVLAPVREAAAELLQEARRQRLL